MIYKLVFYLSILLQNCISASECILISMLIYFPAKPYF